MLPFTAGRHTCADQRDHVSQSHRASPDVCHEGSVIRACFSTEDQVLVATTDCGGVQSSCRFDFTTEGNRIEYIEGGVMCYFEGNKNEVVGPRTTKMISSQVRGVNARMECVSGRRE